MFKRASKFMQHRALLAAGVYRPGKKPKGGGKNNRHTWRFATLYELCQAYQKANGSRRAEMRGGILKLWNKVKMRAPSPLASDQTDRFAMIRQVMTAIKQKQFPSETAPDRILNSELDKPFEKLAEAEQAAISSHNGRGEKVIRLVKEATLEATEKNLGPNCSGNER